MITFETTFLALHCCVGLYVKAVLLPVRCVFAARVRGPLQMSVIHRSSKKRYYIRYNKMWVGLLDEVFVANQSRTSAGNVSDEPARDKTRDMLT